MNQRARGGRSRLGRSHHGAFRGSMPHGFTCQPDSGQPVTKEGKKFAGIMASGFFPCCLCPGEILIDGEWVTGFRFIERIVRAHYREYRYQELAVVRVDMEDGTAPSIFGSKRPTSMSVDARRTIAIVQHAMCSAPHWYVISSDLLFHTKFNHIEDALMHALCYVLPENIEISD